MIKMLNDKTHKIYSHKLQYYYIKYSNI